MYARSRSAFGRVAAAAAALAAATLSPPAHGSGGTVIRKTDGSFDGFIYGLAGTGQDRFLTRYEPTDFDVPSLICGARVGEINPTGVVNGPMRGDLRLEDPGNPGYPDLSPDGLVAMVDPASVGACRTNPSVPRIFTFGGGGGIPTPPGQILFLSAIEPLHGPNPNDFCGLTTDTNGPVIGASAIISNSAFTRVPFNHFNEIISLGLSPLGVREARAHGKPRFPGDRGLPVYFARRPTADLALPHMSTNDKISTTIVLDNPGPLLPLSVDLSIAVDLSVIAPGMGFKEILRFFRTVGTGSAVMNPITIPDGRTILRLEIPGDLPDRFEKRTPVNVPFRYTITDHTTGNPLAVRADVLGLRTICGIPDDSSAELFVVAQPPPSQPGDALNVRHALVDLPTSVPYTITGLEVVAGEFGGGGLPGLDAVELRSEDFVFAGSPDLSTLGLLRSFGTADGIGEVPTGPPPKTVTLDTVDFTIDPRGPGSFAGDLFARALLLPGETTPFTAIGADRTFDTLLPYSSVTVSGLLPATPDPASNYMIRLLINGQGGTLVGERRDDRWNGRSRPYALAFGEMRIIPLDALME